MNTVDEVLDAARGLPPSDRERLRHELEVMAAEETPAPVGDFWQERRVQELAVLQGVAVPGSLDELIGKGVDLWDDEPAFEDFVRGIYERREGNRARPPFSSTRTWCRT